MAAHDRHALTPKRGWQKGVVSLEILLSLPVIFLALGGAMFVSTYMKQRAAICQHVADAVRLCSRGIPDVDAQTCVVTRLQSRTAWCTTLDVQAQVEVFETNWDDPELYNPLTKRLGLLRVDVGCTMEVQMPLFSVGELEFRTQAAMPMRLETEAMP
jgi:hypothetical protein